MMAKVALNCERISVQIDETTWVWWKSTKTKQTFLKLQVIILLRNLPEGFAMGNLTDHEGRTTKA